MCIKEKTKNKENKQTNERNSLGLLRHLLKPSLMNNPRYQPRRIFPIKWQTTIPQNLPNDLFTNVSVNLTQHITKTTAILCTAPTSPSIEYCLGHAYFTQT